MKAPCLLAFATCLVLSPLRAENQTPAPPAVPPSAPKPTTVHVTVIAQDAAQQPLAGVTLRGVQTGTRGPSDVFKSAFEGTTDDQGQWTADIPFGQYFILATRGPLVAEINENHNQGYWNLNESALKRELPLTLREGGDLSVHVIDATTNAPMTDTRVVLEDCHTAITDDHGQAKFRAVSFKEHTVLCYKAPYADQSADFNNSGQPYTEVKVAMAPGFQVQGHVKDRAGKPIANAMVRDHYSGKTILCERHRCITDANGHYELGWYATAHALWSFGAEHPDFAKQNKANLQPPAKGNVALWDFVLDEGYSIAGFVKDERGQPIKSAEVRYGADPSWIDSRTVRSGDDGLFRIQHLSEPRSEQVIAHAKGFAPSAIGATPGKGNKAPQLNFTLVKGINVSGRLIDTEGQPVAGASFSPRWDLDGRPEYAVTRRFSSDKEGNFTLEDLPSAGNSIDIYGPGFSDIRRMPFDPHRPLLFTVDKSGIIAGKVLDDETGQAITHFNVRLSGPRAPRQKDEPAGPFTVGLAIRGQDCKAGDGSFVIEGLTTRAGYAVHIAAEGYLTGEEDKVISRPVDDKDWPRVFRLKRGHPVGGTLVDARTGKPVGGGQLLLHLDPNKAISYSFENLQDWHTFVNLNDAFEKHSDAKGRFEFSVADPQRPFFSFINAAGYAPVIVTQPASKVPQDWNIDLTPGGTLQVKLGNLITPADQNAMVEVYAGSIHFIRQPQSTEHEFTLGHVPEGPVAICVRRDPGNIFSVSASAVVTVKSDETATVDFAKLPTTTLRCVATLDGRPLPRVFIDLIPACFSLESTVHVGFGTTNATGVTVVRNLPPVPVSFYPHPDSAAIHMKHPGAMTVDLSGSGEHCVTIEYESGPPK